MKSSKTNLFAKEEVIVNLPVKQSKDPRIVGSLEVQYKTTSGETFGSLNAAERHQAEWDVKAVAAEIASTYEANTHHESQIDQDVLAECLLKHADKLTQPLQWWCELTNTKPSK